MRKTTKKKIAPIAIALLAVLYLGLLAAFILAEMGLLDSGESVSILFPLLCTLIVLGAGIVGVVKALLQRLNEIDGGEEEEASRY